MTEAKKCARCGAPLPAQLSEELCPVCALQGALQLGSTENASDARGVPLRESTSSGVSVRYFGDYELLEEIARGGMGVVYKARQLSLNRLVALKMILAGNFAGAQAVQRFRAEASAAARLQHPNIVAIHEVGEHRGQQYFSMDYVEGRNLAEVARDQPLSSSQAAAYLKSIAEAIHYAHQNDILHRDLKPSNVLIDQFDQPRITDFGLAKQLETESDLTVTGQVLGSPNFMPPEQAAGIAGQVGPQSDVYSLGAMLYHLLTGRPPFQGGSVQEVLLQAREIEPVAPRRLNPSVPVDLETICLKCLEKDALRRYATARELADELTRFLRGEPILARPITPLEKTWRWCKRYPAVAGLGGAVALLLAVVAIGATIAAVRIKRAESLATERLRESYLAQARAIRSGTHAGRRFNSLDVLSKASRIRPSLELRNEAIAALALADLKLAWRKEELGAGGQCVCLDRELRRYAVADKLGAITVHPVDDDRVLARLPGDGNQLDWIKFSPNGKWLAVRSEAGDVRLLNLAESRTVFATPGSKSRNATAFTPDSEAVAIAQPDNAITFYATSSGARLRSFRVGIPAADIAFRPDGARMAVAAADRNGIQILEADSGKLIRQLPIASLVFGIAWHPDGQRLASVGEDRFVTLWNTETGERLEQLRGHLGHPFSVTFSHDGEWLASSGWDGVIRLWDVALGQNVVTIDGGGWQLHFSPDDKAIGCAGWDGKSLQLYTLADSGVLRTLYRRKAGPDQGDGAADISPDGGLVAYSNGRAVRLWRRQSRTDLGIVPTRTLSSVMFLQDGGGLISSGPWGVWLWPVERAEQQDRLVVGPPRSLSTSPSQRAACSTSNIVAVVHGDYCRIYDLRTRRRLREVGPHRNLISAAASHDGRWIATGVAAGGEAVKIWETQTGKLVRELPSDENPAIAFSPDDRSLVVGTKDGYQFWRTSDWQPRYLIKRSPTEQMSGVATFSPDGRLFAAAQTRSLIKLYESATGAEVAALESPNWQELSTFSFSHDSSLLVVSRATYAVELWNLRLLREELDKLNLDWNQPPYPSEAPADPMRPQVLDVRTEGATYLGNLPRSAWDLDVPPRPPEAGPEQIDLSLHYNAPLTPSWQSVGPGQYAEGNDLAELPAGVHTLAGVRFDIRGVVQLASATTVQIGDKFPQQVTGISVGRKCRRIHFLHNAIIGVVPDGMKVANYVVHYSDGSVEGIPVISGREIKDFWVPRDGSDPASKAEIAWRGANEMSRRHASQIGLFKFTWQNPHPEVEIETIDFVSAMNVPAPFLVAITAE